MGRVAGAEEMIRIHRILIMKPEKKKPYVATGGKFTLKYIIREVIHVWGLDPYKMGYEPMVHLLKMILNGKFP